jgi:hypothetical protein
MGRRIDRIVAIAIDQPAFVFYASAVVTEVPLVVQPLAEAIAEAESIIRSAPHIRSQQDVIEGYEYLAGSIRAAIQAAWSFDSDFPQFIRTATPSTKIGLDNPDTLYFSARIRGDGEYVVSGQRGTTADLSFQVLNGDYSPASVPDSLSAFDDRALVIDDDGSFELRFRPGDADPTKNEFSLAPDAAMLLVRETFGDWTNERPGTLRIRRADRAGEAPRAPTEEAIARCYRTAAKILVTQLKTFLAFPERFYLNLPANTLTEPRLTPGGLATQYSSAGHYDLSDNQAMIVIVPASDAPYQGIQLGSMWYISMDFVNHQTSLTRHQAQADADGKLRFVISERDPGMTNWLECTGHGRGYVQIRWQRVTRELTVADGPSTEVVAFEDIPRRLPHYLDSRITAGEWRARIAERQTAVANRMLA